MVDQPLVSVVTIFLNCERFLAEAIDSVLAQSYANWELILVDDGSSDGSTDIARAYARQHPNTIRYVDHDGHRNLGMSASRNRGVRDARGHYICLLDGDDVFLPSKLERQVAFLEANPDVSMVYGPTEYWHSWTGAPEDADRDHRPDLGLGDRHRFAAPELLSLVYPLGKATAPCLCSLLIRTDAFRRCGGFEESFRGFYEDQAFLTKVYASETVAILDECHDRYRIHPQSCSAMVREAGSYDSYRARFLGWLKNYLQNRHVTDATVIGLLDDAIGAVARDGEPVSSHSHWMRALRVDGGSAATLEMPRDNPDMVRIAIAGAPTAVSHDIQLNLPRLTVSAGRRYTVTFLARSDRPRTIAVGLADTGMPWANLGLYADVALTTVWQSFDFTLVATRDQSDARIHFDVGQEATSVEISAVTMRDIDGGHFVCPTQPSVDGQAGAAFVPLGGVDFGSLRRVTPISDEFGCDRGGAVDRYYIDKFLDAHRADVKGAVLEIGDNTYTKRFGGDRVISSDVLHVTEGDPAATIIADLTSAEHVPSNTFDCFILTQTLQLIYDVRAALATIHRILKPGGVLLATFPGISQIYDKDWSGTWYWNFTHVSARRLFEEAFGAEGVDLEVFGNVLAATAFLNGVGANELRPEELDYRGAGYDVTIAVRAVKAAADRPPAAVHKTSSTSCSHTDRPAVRSRSASEARGLVLMYHRVSEGHGDPWSLCVSPQHFDEQLEVLQRFAHSMPLSELADRLERRDVSDRGVVVTFDDGYADNLRAAAPILEAHGTPATVFAATGYIGGDREFWWDELEALLLTPGDLPNVIALNVNGRDCRWELEAAQAYSDADWRRDLDWRADDPPRSSRHTVFLALWRVLQPMSETARRTALADLWRQAGRSRRTRDSHAILTVDELVELERKPLVEIGAHTVTHPVLSQLPADEQTEEMTQSKVWLEEALGTRVTSLAYPYGAHTEETMALARNVGFKIACTTVSDKVSTKSDLTGVPRVEVRDWPGPEFARRLAAWLS